MPVSGLLLSIIRIELWCPFEDDSDADGTPAVCGMIKHVKNIQKHRNGVL